MSNKSTIADGGFPITLVTTTETVVARSTMYGVNSPGGQGICISGVVNVTGGTGNTNMLLRVRQPDINGSVVGSNGAQNDSMGAGTIRSLAYEVLDTNDPVGVVTYVVTLQQVAATGNGTVNRASISLEAATAIN
jgi:hypothetical protein